MSDLTNRLRGIYTIPVNDGAGPLDGKTTVTRTFDNLPPIMGEAADRIEALEREIAAMTEAYENMRAFARASGLDTTARISPPARGGV